MLIMNFSSARSCMALFKQIIYLRFQRYRKWKNMFKMLCNVGCAAAVSIIRALKILNFVIVLYKEFIKNYNRISKV